MSAKTLSAAGCVLALALAASAGIVPDVDLKLPPWKTKAEEWRGAPAQGTSVSDWTGYDRLAFDVVSYAVGGDPLNIVLRSPKPQGGMVHVRTPCFDAHTYEVRLERFSKVGVDLSCVTGMGFSVRWAQATDIGIRNVRLLRKGETAEEFRPDAKTAGRLKALRTAWEAGRAAVHSAAFARWRGVCAAAGTVSQGAVFGKASPMLMVRPREDFEAEPATDLGVRLARNEKESLQLLVAPDGADLEHVKVEVSDLKLERPFWKVWDRTTFAATNVTVAPMGYVDLKRAPEHTVRKARIVPGWFPDPILDFLGAVDIRGNDVQGFWIKVRCPSGQKAGVYRGQVRVTWIAGGQAQRWEAPFGVRVYDFAIGTVPPVHLSMSFRPGFSCSNWERLGRIVGTEDYKVQQWIHAHTNCAPYLARMRTGEWADFLADNLMTIDYLYPGPEPQWDELVRLKAEGRLDVFNLKYWGTHSADERWIADARRLYGKAKALGLADHAVFYGCDELTKERFAKAEAAAARLKREFPEVPLVTTAWDNSYSLDSPLKSIDVFIPLTATYKPETAARARSAGKRVGWYVCGGGDDPGPEFFFGRDAIEPRLLTSAAAAKLGPDWFLYYAMAGWSTIEPITSGPFTSWSPEGWGDYAGDGNIVACGPGGRPLSTQRLENFRDGLEDLWYARLYREKFGKDAEVPDAVVKSLREFTRDPKALQAWRDRMADLIEAKKGN